MVRIGRKKNAASAAAYARKSAQTKRSGGASRSNADQAGLLEQLQAHQLELEAQNEELRRSRQELERTQRRYQHLYDFSPAGYVTLDRKGVIRSLNLTAARLLGKEKTILVNTPLAAMVARQDLDVLFSHLKRVFGSPETQICELRTVRRGRVERYVELRSHASSEVDGEATRCLTSIVDITERKRTEGAVRAARQRLQLALSASHMGVWEWDLRTDELFWSPETFQLLGVQASATTLKSFKRLLHPDDAERVMAAARRGIAEKKDFRGEFRVIRPDGRLVWLFSIGRGEYDDAGGALRVMGTVQDVTERKMLEREVALREQWFSSFFAGATAGLALLDRELRYIRINNTLAEMNGLSAAGHIGKSVHEVLPKLAPAVAPVLKQVLLTGKPVQNIEVAGETPKHEGIRRHWIESFFPLVGAEGRPEGIGAIVVETTKLKQAEEAVRRYAQEVEEANSALKVLLKQRDSEKREVEEKVLANVKQLILPYIEMLKVRHRDNREDTASLTVIETRLNEVISSFAARLSHKMTSLTPKEVLVSDLVKEGMPDKDIADLLHLSIDTVKAHRRNIRKKLGLTGEKMNLRTFLASLEQ